MTLRGVQQTALFTLLLIYPATAQQFDATRLKTGTFAYTVRDKQKEIATGVLSIERRSPGSYAFQGTFTAAACQHWESNAGRNFEPVSALLRFCKDGTNRAIFELDYKSQRVSGVKYQGKPPDIKSVKVDSAVPANTVDQRIDWAAVMALNLKPGLKYQFGVYDPGTGISPLVGSVDGAEHATVPAGSFEAYRLVYQMKKPGGDEHYQSWVTVNTPRVLLRIRFPDSSIVDLVGQKAK